MPRQPKYKYGGKTAFGVEVKKHTKTPVLRWDKVSNTITGYESVGWLRPKTIKGIRRRK